MKKCSNSFKTDIEKTDFFKLKTKRYYSTLNPSWISSSIDIDWMIFDFI